MIANKELADLSKTLATIEINGEFAFSYEDAKTGDFYTKEAYEQFKRLGFKNSIFRQFFPLFLRSFPKCAFAK